MSTIYFQHFTNYEDLLEEFAIARSVVAPEEILYAYYGLDYYTGMARVLFMRDGILYEVTGDHCSCFGLEGQWLPEVVTWEQLALRPGHDTVPKDGPNAAAREAWATLVRARVPRA